MDYNFVIYDVESFPNFFSFDAYDVSLDRYVSFEVSWRKNQIGSLHEWLKYWESNGYYMIGYNSLAYDYPMIHEIMTGEHYNTAAQIYTINQRIINTPWNERHNNTIKPYLVRIKQIDLFKVHHFDNKDNSETTSLKKIEFTMRVKSIEESKYPFGVPLPETDEAANDTMTYNRHDIINTYAFFKHSLGAIMFRFTMSEKYKKNFLNHNDTKIGKDYFIMELGKAGVKCYDHNYDPIQTWRDSIPLKDCIFPIVCFESPEFKHIHKTLLSTVVYETKGSLKISAVLDNFSFDFGLGGIHGSVKGAKFESNDDFIIVDADVTSYYPRIAMVNKIYPEHLGVTFCDVYLDVFNQRSSYEKGTVENAAMKLALNGVYGDSNSIFSPFYDPKYTMTVTVNGQLLLCMLSEQLMKIPGLQMIQINTDGLTVKLPRAYQDHYYAVCEWWQKLTRLNLEFVNYSKMIVRDVNNYIAIGEDGKVKYKGAYVPFGANEGVKDSLEWHKNHSMLVVKKAAVAAILKGTPVASFIRNHDNIYDFFKLARTTKRTDKLVLKKDVVWDGQVISKQQPVCELQTNNRYIVSNDGYSIIKISPPLKRRTPNVDMVHPNWQSKKVSGFNKNRKVKSLSEYETAIIQGYKTKDGGRYDIGPIRTFEVEKGYLATIHNDLESEYIEDYDINYEYYINEAEKLVHAIQGSNYD